MKQVFKGKTLYTKTVVRRITEVYNQATDHNDWYKEANDFAFQLSYRLWDKDPATRKQAHAKACGIIAALSPLKSWDENMNIAKLFVLTGQVKHTAVMGQKAKDILSSDGSLETISTILNGSKITSFFLNIYRPSTSQAVTIDRHAISIALGYSITDNFSMTSKQYEFFQNCYRIASLNASIKPLQMQAITWVEWRKQKATK
jgi:hypothetical protein